MNCYQKQRNSASTENCSSDNFESCNDFSCSISTVHKEYQSENNTTALKPFAPLDMKKEPHSSDAVKNFENTTVSKTNLNIDNNANERFSNSKSISCTTPSSTPILIISDTSTDVSNFVIETKKLCTSNVSERTSTAARPIICKKLCNDTDSSGTCIFQNTGSDTGIETDSDSTLFFPLKVPVCDSAYGSSMESRSGTLSPSVYCNSERTTSRHSSENELVSSAEPLADHCDSLSVCFPVSPIFSSTSSIASDYTGEIETNDSDTLQVGQEQRKLSSSSSISLRSFNSINESEDDHASGDDLPLRFNMNRRNSKMKAQKSWLKLRMAIWSPFMQSYKKRYPWVQLAGHAGSFQPGEEGCILKKYVEREAKCLEGFKNDLVLHDLVPVCHGIVMRKNEKYTRMQDLLLQFECPSIMDCKMGIRTYLEVELTKAKVNPCLRPDMYQKMIDISPEEPTEEENKQKAVIKPRYMQWREKVSSTSTLGFRIEGIKKSGKDPSKDFKLTKTTEDVSAAFKSFIDGNQDILKKYLERLKSMRKILENSHFFQCHEAIGSSLLFVHDSTGLANVWMIDFGKTTKLPENVTLNHRSEWVEGNREDGYLFGMDNMINIFDAIHQQLRGEDDTKSTEGEITKSSMY